LDIDLNLKDNRLSVLDDKIVIKGYNSKLAFHHNKITATGSGKIRGKLFDIRINPNNKADDHESSLIRMSVAFKCILGKSFGVISQSLLIVSKLVTCNPNILTFGMSFSFGKTATLPLTDLDSILPRQD
jgi:hypothetical protein